MVKWKEITPAALRLRGLKNRHLQQHVNVWNRGTRAWPFHYLDAPHTKRGSRSSVVDNRDYATGWTIRGSISDKGRKTSSSAKLSDRLGGPPTLRFKGHSGRGVKLKARLHLQSRYRMNGCIPLHPQCNKLMACTGTTLPQVRHTETISFGRKCGKRNAFEKLSLYTNRKRRQCWKAVNCVRAARKWNTM